MKIFITLKKKYFTMISIALQREVPQYIAIPWLITCVIARTISKEEEKDWYALKFHINPSI